MSALRLLTHPVPPYVISLSGVCPPRTGAGVPQARATTSVAGCLLMLTAIGQTGTALKAALHQLIRNHTRFSYTCIWTILMEADEDPQNTNNVVMIYSGRSVPKTRRDRGQNDLDRLEPRTCLAQIPWLSPGRASTPIPDAHHLSVRKTGHRERSTQ